MVCFECDLTPELMQLYVNGTKRAELNPVVEFRGGAFGG